MTDRDRRRSWELDDVGKQFGFLSDRLTKVNDLSRLLTLVLPR